MRPEVWSEVSGARLYIYIYIIIERGTRSMRTVQLDEFENRWIT